MRPRGICFVCGLPAHATQTEWHEIDVDGATATAHFDCARQHRDDRTRAVTAGTNYVGHTADERLVPAREPAAEQELDFNDR